MLAIDARMVMLVLTWGELVHSLGGMASAYSGGVISVHAYHGLGGHPSHTKEGVSHRMGYSASRGVQNCPPFVGVSPLENMARTGGGWECSSMLR